MAETGRSFWKSILHKIDQATEWVFGLAKQGWNLLATGGEAVVDTAVATAKISWSAICWVGHYGWIGLQLGGRAGLWALAMTGKGVHWTGRTVVSVATWLVSTAALLIVMGVTGVALTVNYLLLAVLKVVQFVALLLASPYLALTARDQLRQNWHLFWVGLKPQNWHITHEISLITETLRDRELKTQRRAARAAAATDSTPNGAKKSAAPRRRKPRTLDPSLA